MSIAEDFLKAECVTMNEAVQIMKKSNGEISRLCRNGKLNGAFRVGTTWLIPRASAENYKPLPRGRQPKPRRECGERANGEKFAAMLNNMELSVTA